jgi:mannose-6-phosphate isomerase-like protein (cupin superfamily)
MSRPLSKAYRPLVPGAFSFLLCAAVAAGGQRVPPLSESATLPGLPAAARAVPIPAGRQVFFRRADIPMVEIRQGMRRGVVLGEGISVSVDELDPRFIKGSPPESAHHHTHEQADFGWEGTLEVFVDGRRMPVGPMSISMVPPDVPHTVTRVMGPGTVTSLEFSAVRREDLLPGRPQVSFPSSPEPRSVPEGFAIFKDFDAMEWVGEPGTSRFVAALGETMTVFVYHVPASGMKGAEAPGHHHTNEQISVVLRGHAEIRLGDQFQTVGPGTIMVVPPDVDHYGMSPVNDEDLVLIEFQPIVREDMRRAMAAHR